MPLRLCFLKIAMECWFHENDAIEEFLHNCIFGLGIWLSDRLKFSLSLFIDSRLRARRRASVLEITSWWASHITTDANWRTDDSNARNSCSFACLYSSISFVASARASLSRCTRSDIFLLRHSVQKLDYHAHCRACCTTFAASFSASRSVWIPCDCWAAWYTPIRSSLPHADEQNIPSILAVRVKFRTPTSIISDDTLTRQLPLISRYLNTSLVSMQLFNFVDRPPPLWWNAVVRVLAPGRSLLSLSLNWTRGQISAVTVWKKWNPRSYGMTLFPRMSSQSTVPYEFSSKSITLLSTGNYSTALHNCEFWVVALLCYHLIRW